MRVWPSGMRLRTTEPPQRPPTRTSIALHPRPDPAARAGAERRHGRTRQARRPRRRTLTAATCRTNFPGSSRWGTRPARRGQRWERLTGAELEDRAIAGANTAYSAAVALPVATRSSNRRGDTAGMPPSVATRSATNEGFPAPTCTTRWCGPVATLRLSLQPGPGRSPRRGDRCGSEVRAVAVDGEAPIVTSIDRFLTRIVR